MDHDPSISVRPSPVAGEHPASGARVLFIDNSFTFGGAIICLRYLVEGLEELGVDSLVISGQSREVMHRFFGPARSVDVGLPARWRHEPNIRRFLGRVTPDGGWMSRAVGTMASLETILLRIVPRALRYAWTGFRKDVDLVHLNNTLESQLDGLLAARILGVPCVAHARGFQRSGRLVRWMIGGVARHIAISRAVRENLLEIGISDERISLIHDAVDLEEFAEPRDTKSVRQELGIPTAAVTFGMLGRIVEWKGVKEFVSAAIRVLEGDPNAYALIVGDESDGAPSYFREVRRLAKSSSVRDRIVLTGYREDIPAVMQTLDVVVHTSVAPEPFGLVVAEAMAAGKPVVAADRGGPRDIVLEGETGYLVNPRDTAALAETIESLLRDPDLARELGRSGRERARERFGTERYALEVADLYEEVLRAPGSSTSRDRPAVERESDGAGR